MDGTDVLRFTGDSFQGSVRLGFKYSTMEHTLVPTIPNSESVPLFWQTNIIHMQSKLLTVSSIQTLNLGRFHCYWPALFAISCRLKNTVIFSRGLAKNSTSDFCAAHPSFGPGMENLERVFALLSMRIAKRKVLWKKQYIKLQQRE